MVEEQSETKVQQDLTVDTLAEELGGIAANHEERIRQLEWRMANHIIVNGKVYYPAKE